MVSRLVLSDPRRSFSARDPKELWLIPGAEHVDFLEFAGEDYRRRISAFFARTLGGVSPAGN